MSRINEHDIKEAEIKEGDTVVISLSLLNSFNTHCNSEDDIPEHNHGTVTKIVKPRDRDKNGGLLHPSPYSEYGRYDYVTFKMPNGKELSLFSKNLRKLY